MVIVSENVATRFWPGRSAIGQRIKIGGLASTSPWLTIVGVVGEVKYRGLPENPTRDPDLYFPFLDRSQQVSLVIRTRRRRIARVAGRQVIRDINPNIPVFAVDDHARHGRRSDRAVAIHDVADGRFAGVALLLAAVGIYGVMSYLVLSARGKSASAWPSARRAARSSGWWLVAARC